MRTIQAILTLSLLALALGYDPCRRAFRQCDWEFAGYPGKIPKFSVHSKPDQPFTPRIVSKNPKEKIGILNTNGITPEFITRKGAVPITKFGNPYFTPTHFKPFGIDYVMGSGVGHQTFHGNQKKVARGQCVRVFFTNFQKLMHGYPPKVDNVNVDRYDYKCVVFRLH